MENNSKICHNFEDPLVPKDLPSGPAIDSTEDSVSACKNTLPIYIRHLMLHSNSIRQTFSDHKYQVNFMR